MSDPQPAIIKRVPHAASGELGIVPLISHLVHELAKPRFVWVVSGFTCCGPGGWAISDPLGRLDISGVFADKERALSAFYKKVAGTWTSGGNPSVSTKHKCWGRNGCDECFSFCKAEQIRSLPKYKASGIKDAKKEYDDAVYALNMTKTEEGERKVQYKAEDLEYWQTYNEDDLTSSDIYELWRGPEEDESIRQLLVEEVGAWRFFHFDNVEDDGEGGLRFYEEVCEGDIINETCMKRTPLA